MALLNEINNNKEETARFEQALERLYTRRAQLQRDVQRVLVSNLTALGFSVINNDIQTTTELVIVSYHNTPILFQYDLEKGEVKVLKTEYHMTGIDVFIEAAINIIKSIIEPTDSISEQKPMEVKGEEEEVKEEDTADVKKPFPRRV